MNRISKSFSTILLIIVALLIAGLVFFYMETQRLVEQRNPVRTVESPVPDTISQDLYNLMALDDALFAGRYQQALRGYKDLLAANTAVEEKKLRTRINYLQQRDDGEEQALRIEPVGLLSAHYADSIELLARKIDSIRGRYDRLSDSMENKITELNRQIRDRNRVLEQREQLQATAFENTDGQTIHYVGQTKNKMANGTGTGIWQNSSGVYKGDWLDNRRHGYGIYTWADGERYEGNYTNDKRNGKGVYYWPSGERYEGEWKNNRRHGKGVLYDPDGNISYDGLWEDDKPKK